jgi:tetratricopeptide (TPR) repeat protein
LALLFAGGAAPARAAEPAPAAPPTPPDALAASAVDSPADAQGDQLLRAGELAAAAAAYQQAIDLNLGSAATHVKLGRVELWRGDHRAAQRALRRALELEPAHAEAHLLLGETHDELGHDRRARREYRRAFQLEPALTDPVRHPEVARNRQALAALLELWHDELDADPARASAGAGSFAAAPTAVRSPAVVRPRAAARATPRAAPAAKAEVVIDASDLRSRGSVNQLQPSGQSESGRRRFPSAPRTPTRYTPPPPPPPEPEPEPEPEDLEALEEAEAEATAEEEEPLPEEEEEPPPSGL